MESLKSSEISETHQKSEKEENFHVLAVDDSLMDRRLLEKLLTVSSYQVTCVDSGDKALEYLGLLERDDSEDSSSLSIQSSNHEGLKVNLIMTDYSMPGMSGYDLLKRVKGSSWKDVPVIVMSSENVPSRITMCLEGGAEEFLFKPLKLSDLKKIQPYIHKSLNPKNNETMGRDENDINGNINYMGNNNNKGMNYISKRKGISPEPLEKRSKMKELEVV